MTDHLESRDCGRNKQHPAHRFMLGRQMWQCPGRAETEPAPHAVDTITPEALEQLYADRDAARAAADRYLTNGTKAVERLHWQAHNAEQRADRAEAAIDRVRAECDRIETAIRDNQTHPDLAGGYLGALRHIRAALDEPQESQS